MTRAALYARYSSDLQREVSIEDQFRVCRAYAEREGWTVAGAYRDAAVSGASVILRPGVQALLADARAGSFDVVLSEALDRVSRDQADVAMLFKHLRFAGVTIVTLAEGEITELHVGLKGTMNALFLKDLAAKTWRGLRGRAERGKSGGGLCYGYDVVKTTDAAGEPVRGERRVDEAEAAIVRRVFREFATGVSPRAIARRLNEEGVPGPSGKPWTDSTLRGHARRGTGLVNNELYVGRLIWNRLRYVKNPDTGKRVSRINPPEEWVVTEVPELRIVDDALWQAVKDRQRELSARYATVIEATRAARANRLNDTHRPRHLLSGLLHCGVCGGPYAMRGQDRYGCSNHVMNGSCANGRGIARTILEDRVLAGLKDRLIAPEAAAEAMRAYAEETNRLNRERRASGEDDRKELAGGREEDRGYRRGHRGRRLYPRADGPVARTGSPAGRTPGPSRNRARRHPRHSSERRRHLPAQGGTPRGCAAQPPGARRGGRGNPRTDRTHRAHPRRKAGLDGRDAAWRSRRRPRMDGKGRQRERDRRPGARNVGLGGCGGRIRTCDLQVMSRIFVSTIRFRLSSARIRRHALTYYKCFILSFFRRRLQA